MSEKEKGDDKEEEAQGAQAGRILAYAMFFGISIGFYLQSPAAGIAGTLLCCFLIEGAEYIRDKK